MKIMKRLTQVGLAVLIAGLVLLLKGSSPLVTTATAQTQDKAQQQAKESTRSAPPDTTPYTRPALPEDSAPRGVRAIPLLDRKSTRLNSSHVSISYAVFCLKKKKNSHSTLAANYPVSDTLRSHA